MNSTKMKYLILMVLCARLAASAKVDFLVKHLWVRIAKKIWKSRIENDFFLFCRTPCFSLLTCVIYLGKFGMPGKIVVYVHFILTKKKPFISDQEQVAKQLISNDTRIIYMTINGDFPIHFATKQSALEKSQNSASNWVLKLFFIVDRENMVKILVDQKASMLEMKMVMKERHFF